MDKPGARRGMNVFIGNQRENIHSIRKKNVYYHHGMDGDDASQ
jgi:hypothetical protein